MIDGQQFPLWVRERVRHGITQSKRRRKYCPPGPYSPVEQEALTALLEVEQAAERLLASTAAEALNELDLPDFDDLMGPEFNGGENELDSGTYRSYV